MLVVLYLVTVGGVQAAPAVRVGYSWASNNLRLIQTYTTMSCLLFVCVNLILGQAQLVVRSVRAARLWPTRRYPATFFQFDTVQRVHFPLWGWSIFIL